MERHLNRLFGTVFKINCRVNRRLLFSQSHRTFLKDCYFIIQCCCVYKLTNCFCRFKLKVLLIRLFCKIVFFLQGFCLRSLNDICSFFCSKRAAISYYFVMKWWTSMQILRKVLSGIFSLTFSPLFFLLEDAYLSLVKGLSCAG